ncbi:MAG: (2Fe-2S)-binding protein [Paenibacillus sp.]|nr:(2Fe-2S)-binding protein [Paenibacillus sp.]
MDDVLAQEWIPAELSANIVNQPLKVTVLGVGVVLFRSSLGVTALQDVCVHRGAPLSLGSVKENCIVCPYHGWEYNAEGMCIKIPQLPVDQKIPLKAHTKAYACLEKFGIVWVKLKESSAKDPVFVEYENNAFQWLSLGPYPVNASAPRLIENFLDVGHLAFLHEGYLGDSAFPEISDYKVYREQDKWVTDEIEVLQPNADGRGKSVLNHYVYEIHNPVTVRFRKLDKETGDTVSILLSVLPHSEGQSSAFFAVAYNFDVDKASFIRFQELIFAQDIDILENQKPELLPLDLQAELHLKSDRISIAYRRYLSEAGIRMGTVPNQRYGN